MVGNNLSKMTSKKKPNKNAALLIKIVPGFVCFLLAVLFTVKLCILCIMCIVSLAA